MTIGERIAVRRRSAGLSQEALAGQLGVSRQAVSRWETGESLPDMEKAVQLCRILGVSADELLLGRTPPSSRPSLRRLRLLCMGLAAAGAALILAGTAGAVFWSVTATEWYADWGRFGTALRFSWPGGVLLGGLLLLLLALALAAFGALLSRGE